MRYASINQYTIDTVENMQAKHYVLVSFRTFVSAFMNPKKGTNGALKYRFQYN